MFKKGDRVRLKGDTDPAREGIVEAVQGNFVQVKWPWSACLNAARGTAIELVRPDIQVGDRVTCCGVTYILTKPDGFFHAGQNITRVERPDGYTTVYEREAAHTEPYKYVTVNDDGSTTVKPVLSADKALVEKVARTIFGFNLPGVQKAPERVIDDQWACTPSVREQYLGEARAALGVAGFTIEAGA